MLSFVKPQLNKNNLFASKFNSFDILKKKKFIIAVKCMHFEWIFAAFGVFFGLAKLFEMLKCVNYA